MLKLFLANLVSSASPPTRGFWLRRALFRWAGVRIGERSKVCGGVRFDNAFAQIGSDCWIGGRTRVIGGRDAIVVIEDRCDLGPETLLVAGSHKIGGPDRRAGSPLSSPITVGSGCWLGARSTVLGGVVIGDSSIVAAGALVTTAIPPNVVAGGVPARRLRDLDVASDRAPGRGSLGHTGPANPVTL